MAEILLLYPSDKGAAAGRLAEAIGAAGYRIELKEVAEQDLAAMVRAEAPRASAVLLIWSRPLVARLVATDALHELRGPANLIEISADGIEPPAPGEESPVILLSGWRGQPFHPGWQRIQAELGRLDGAKSAAPPAAVARRGVVALASGRATAGPAHAGRRKALAALAAAVSLAGAVGAASFFAPNAPDKSEAIARSAPAPAPPAPPMSALPADPDAGTPLASPVMPAAAAPPAPGAAPAPALSAAPAAASPAAGGGDVRTPAGTPTLRSSAQRPSARAEAPRRAAAPRTSQSPPRRAGTETKRYSRKNSKTMRRFCQRSGRGTPQCRIFLRSIRQPRPS